MSTRRAFISQAVAATLVPGRFALSSERTADARELNVIAGTQRFSAFRRDATIVNHGGSGDNWHMSWGADDRLFVSLCDGYGWSAQPTRIYNSRLLSLSGSPVGADFRDIAGYPVLQPSFDTDTRYYGFGTLAVDGMIYQFASTFNRTFPAEIAPGHDLRFIGVKLIYSADNGMTWNNQDGSTPVVWERWGQRSRENMVFFEESQDAFSLLSVAQMGRNYEKNRDGYVYIYSPNGSTDGTMNELVMFRVPKTKIRDRLAYEFFAGFKGGGKATWTKEINERAIVHTFPRGWVNRTYHPWAWMPSVTYNAPLGLYMMASWGTATSKDGMWFDKPSYLGFWVAEAPWGPWRQIHEESAWVPGGDPGTRAFAPQIVPKWIGEDGKSFWLVWSDFRRDEAECTRLDAMGPQRPDEAAVEAKQRSIQFGKCHPMYSFHIQRVDLSVT